MKKIVRRVLIVGVILGVLIQVVPVNRKNPPVTRDIAAQPAVAAILRTSCYDCHSNETRWPFYSYIAPVSWLVTGDVKTGRRQMNFSQWDAYSKAEQKSFPSRIYGIISDKMMPLPKYLLPHPYARLDSLKVEVLHRWSLSLPNTI